MHLENVPVGLVEPRDDQNFIADCQSVKCVGQWRVHFEPGVRCALGSLLRRLLPCPQGGMNHTDWSQLKLNVTDIRGH